MRWAGSAVGARDAIVSLATFFWIKLIRFGQIWLDLGKIEAKFG